MSKMLPSVPPGATVTRELVRDPVEMIFSDGRRYATQRWWTKCEDLRCVDITAQAEGPVLRCIAMNFGWVHMGEPFPTEDSVESPFYEPPTSTSWGRRIFGKR